MVKTVAAFASSKSTRPSVNDYSHFHGMLCAPSTARRCVESFDGTVLFMPIDYLHSQDIQQYDCTRPIMTVFSYYFLVLVSFTGLSTLFRQTTIHVAREEERKPIKAPITANHNAELVMNQSVVDYLKLRQPSSTDFYLKRRFEYHFCGLLPLSVVMLHVTCNLNKLHLVEIYKFDYEWQQRICRWLSNVGLNFWRKFSS